MSRLAESMWANVPDAPVSAGQNATRRSQDTRTSGAGLPLRGTHTSRRRGRGGGNAKLARQSAPPESHTPTAPATEPPTVTTSAPTDVTPSTAAPRDTPYKSKSEGPRNANRAVPTTTTVRAPPSEKDENATTVKTPPSEKGENVASEAVPNGSRKSSRKRGNKTLPGAKRKTSLAISASANEPLPAIIEPATSLSQSVGGIPSSIMTEEAIAAPDSPKATSHSSGPETLPPSTPSPDQGHQSLKPLPAVAQDSASIRPLTPASTSHIDWADDDDADDLPDLDDWGFTTGKPEPRPQAQRRRSSGAKTGGQAEGLITGEVVVPVVSEDPRPLQPKVAGIRVNPAVVADGSAKSPAEDSPTAARSKGAQARSPLTEAQLAEKRRLRNEKAKERRKIKKMASNEASAAPAPPKPNPVPESRSGTEDIARRTNQLTMDDGKTASALTSKGTVPAFANTPVSLPAKPASSPDNPSISPSAKTPLQPPKSPPSLPLRPAPPPTPSSVPPSNGTFPPRRKPFGGEPALNMNGQPYNSRNHPSDSPRASRRERPSSLHHMHPTSRPVISQSALSQLTKSLSGGTRTHRPTVAAE